MTGCDEYGHAPVPTTISSVEIAFVEEFLAEDDKEIIDIFLNDCKAREEDIKKLVHQPIRT